VVNERREAERSQCTEQERSSIYVGHVIS